MLAEMHQLLPFYKHFSIIASTGSQLACRGKTGYLCLKHFVEICPLYHPNYIQQTNAIFQPRAYQERLSSHPTDNRPKFLIEKVLVLEESGLVLIYNYRLQVNFAPPPLLALPYLLQYCTFAPEAFLQRSGQ